MLVQPHPTAVVCLVGAIAASATVSAGFLGQAAPSGFRVSGIVVNAYPVVSPNARTVTLTELSRVGFGNVPRSVSLGPDRRFVFEDVTPGRYQLATTIGSKTDVQVDTKDVVDAKVSHRGLTQLFASGRMDDGSDVPLGAWFHIQWEDDQVFAGSLEGRSISVPPGRRYFFVEPPDGVFVLSATSAGVDLLREPLLIEPNAPERVIQVVFTRKSQAPVLARLTGRVTGGAGSLAVRLTRTMFSPGQAVPEPVPVRPDGSFEIEVRPGIYDLHVSSAFRVVRGLAIPLSGRSVDVDLPPGRLFSGAAIRVVDAQGRSIPYGIGPVVLTARGAAGVSHFPVEVPGFWGALPPGQYELTLENLPPQVSVLSLVAGNANLLQQPYVVPADRNPPSLTVVLRYGGQVPERISRFLREPLPPR